MASRKKMFSLMRTVLALNGFVALVLTYFVWTQPIETLKILVALNFLISGIGQLLRAVFFPVFED